jgi:hypothetical protein
MNKLEIKWTQEKVTAIDLACGGSDTTAMRNSSGEILRANEGAHRTRLIVISGQPELKANVTRVQRIAT